MVEEDSKIIKRLTELTDKIDRKALAGAVGIMILSWAGLPIVYYLLVRKNGEKDKSRKMEALRGKSEEAEKS